MQKTSTTSLPRSTPRFGELVRGRWRQLIGRQEVIVLGLLVVVCVILSLQTSTFLAPNNLVNVARALSWIGIAALGESLVIMIGGIDLSVGATMALSGLVGAVALQEGWPLPAALLAGLASGAVVGTINGVLIGQVRLPPFIVTLGTMGIARAFALGITGGAPVRELPADFRALGQANLALGAVSLPVPFVCMLLLAALVALVLRQTVLGRHILVLGTSERALQVASVRVPPLKVVVYTLGGMFAAVGGLLLTARLGVAAPTAAAGYELDVIAAVVIGGVSLFGGDGSIVGVVLGAVLMHVVRNGLVLQGVAGHWQAGAVGAMVLLVILLESWRKRGMSFEF